MSFSDLTFILYFLPAFTVGYWLMPYRFRGAFLFLGSLGFYFWGAGVWNTVFLLALILANYALARQMDRYGGGSKTPLILGLILNVSCLLYFKYTGFFLDNLGRLFSAEFSFTALALPLGISFYVFQSIAYLVDVYRGTISAERSIIKYAAFLTSFPQLTMGPILRYGTWKEDLCNRFLDRHELEQGFQLFVVGLCCKVLIADQLASLWASLERIGFEFLSTPLAWLGAFGYSLQLYFDFSGYSLMAMGLGQMLGISIPRNFDLPYCARSVSEFYRRWHITLGAWFRDYLYIPLGGSRRGAKRMVLALTVVWVLTGLWHGADWNFVLWGIVLLFFILLEKLCIGDFLREHAFLSHLYLLAVIPPTWVIFRISDLNALGAYLSRMFPFFGAPETVYAEDFMNYFSQYWLLFLIAAVLCLPQPRRFYEKYKGSVIVWLPLFLLFWLCIYMIALSSGNSFLYACF